MASETTLVAFIAAALGGSALVAAYRGESWLSVIESTISPSRFTKQPLPQPDSFSGVGATAGGVVSSSPSSLQTDPIHAKAVDYAYSKLGDSYVWGASGPNHYDCSGLTMEACAAAGYKMPHNAELQMQQTAKYKIAKTPSPPPGTLVFFGKGGFAEHCGISIGGGNMIEAPHTGDVVKVFAISNEPESGLPLIMVTDPLSHVGGG